MNLKEKVAYIKGLSDGLKLDAEKDETKVINAIIDLLDEMSEKISDTTDKVDGLAYTVEAIDDELSELEESVYDECCEDSHEHHHHKHHHHHDDCCCSDDCDCDDEEVFYEVTCPTCGEDMKVEEEVLLCGETQCPNCGEILEFDFSSLTDDEEDNCCCDECSDEDEQTTEE